MKTPILIRIVTFSIFGVIVFWHLRSTSRTLTDKIPSGCAVIEGKVLGENGRPVSGATVHSFAPDQPIKGRLPSAPAADADEHGNFSLRCVQPGRNVVGAGKESEGYADSILTPFVDPRLVRRLSIGEHQTIRGVIVSLGPKSGRITGRVIDAATQFPIEGGRVLLCRSERPGECKAINPNTQGAGAFSLLVPPVGFRVRVSAPNHVNWVSDVIHIDPGSERTLIIVMQPSPNAK